MIFHQRQNTLCINNYSSHLYEGVIWENHFHKDFEIVYCICGRLNCVIGGKNDVLSQGEFGMCLPYEAHAYYPEEGTKYRVWGFSDSFVRTFSGIVSDKSGNTFRFTCSKEVCDLVLNTLSDNHAPSVCMLKSCLYALCSEYLRGVTLTEMDRKTTKAYDILSYIESNYKTGITLSQLASHLGYDYHYISRYFKSFFNMNFLDFLNTCRIQASIRLLEESDKRITDIAFECGFQSVRAFNDCFKATMKMSPSEYRKSLLK